jgi:hypothetical protein
MSSGGQQPVTQQTTQSKDPWGPAQPFLQSAMNVAEQYRTSDIGNMPYSGSMQSPEDVRLTSGLAAQTNIANNTGSGTPGVLAGQAQATNMINNQGLTPGLQALAGQYGDIYSQASGQQNPYLQALLDTSNRRIGDRVNSSVSGAGRYGSGAHTDIMTRALAESADPILAQDYQQRQALRMGATGAQADLYGQGLQRAGQWAQLAPTLDAAQYAPAERLASVGQYETDRAQAALNDQIKQYNAMQARPWEQLARYNAIIGGAGGLGGTQVTSSPIQNPSTMQKLFGGAVAGAGIGGSFGGPAGAGAGALGGGLLGLL